jgi:RNA polymerase sigma-70 factor (ECF subfamily)
LGSDPGHLANPLLGVRLSTAWPRHGGPSAAGLEIVDAIAGEPSLKAHRLLPSVCGDFLAKLGGREEARAKFERAAFLTRNARERALLLARAAACEAAPPGA